MSDDLDIDLDDLEAKARDSGARQTIEELSDELMARISEVMPILTVPVIARVLTHSDRVPVGDLNRMVAETLGQLPQGNIALDQERLAMEVDRAMVGLERRELVRRDADDWTVTEGSARILIFYANSIAHFFPDFAASAK